MDVLSGKSEDEMVVWLMITFAVADVMSNGLNNLDSIQRANSARQQAEAIVTQIQMLEQKRKGRRG